MKNNTSILESKLKRHKISYTNANGSIIIGKSKIDYTILFVMIIIPLIIIFISIGFMITKGFIYSKLIVVLVILFSLIIFNIKRLLVKRKSNANTKTIGNKTIKFDNDNKQLVFNKKNILKIDFAVKEINSETFEGSLFLIDTDNNKHQILGFDDEIEKYVVNDLVWFKEYIENYIG